MAVVGQLRGFWQGLMEAADWAILDVRSLLHEKYCGGALLAGADSSCRVGLSQVASIWLQDRQSEGQWEGPWKRLRQQLPTKPHADRIRSAARQLLPLRGT